MTGNQPTMLTVRRRFAVVLEDAFRVTPPPDGQLAEYDGDLWAWAAANLDTLYARANDADDGSVTLLWEDQHKADLDFPEDEITVESE